MFNDLKLHKLWLSKVKPSWQREKDYFTHVPASSEQRHSSGLLSSQGEAKIVRPKRSSNLQTPTASICSPPSTSAEPESTKCKRLPPDQTPSSTNGKTNLPMKDVQSCDWKKFNLSEIFWNFKQVKVEQFIK